MRRHAIYFVTALLLLAVVISLPVVLFSGTFTLNGIPSQTATAMVLANNTDIIQAKDNGGTARNLIFIDSSNNTQVGNTGTILSLNANYANGGEFTVNNAVAGTWGGINAGQLYEGFWLGSGASTGNNVIPATLYVKDNSGSGVNKTSVLLQSSVNNVTTDDLFLLEDNSAVKKWGVQANGLPHYANGFTLAGQGQPPIVNSVTSTGLTANVASANLQCTVNGVTGVCPAGYYRVSVEQITTTTGSAGSTVTTTIAYNDGTASRTKASTACDLTVTTAAGETTNAFYVTLDGVNNLSYSSSGTYNTAPAYTLKIVVERLQ